MEERGQVLPLLAVVILLAGLATAAVVRFGAVAIDCARASTAADAAALAGAANGEDEAKAVAAANGGHLVTYEELGDDSRVRVAVGRVSATARARRSGGGLDDRLPPDRRGVAPAMAAALARADQIIGGHVPVTQVHRPGLAVEVAPEIARRLEALTTETGLCPAGGNSYSLCSPG